MQQQIARHMTPIATVSQTTTREVKNMLSRPPNESMFTHSYYRPSIICITNRHRNYSYFIERCTSMPEASTGCINFTQATPQASTVNGWLNILKIIIPQNVWYTDSFFQYQFCYKNAKISQHIYKNWHDLYKNYQTLEYKLKPSFLVTRAELVVTLWPATWQLIFSTNYLHLIFVAMFLSLLF